MGELVVFRPRTDTIRCAGEAAAEILFFTGVRIVRGKDAEEASKALGRRPGPPSNPPRKRRSRKI